jgi:hypothetical protein
LQQLSALLAPQQLLLIQVSRELFEVEPELQLPELLLTQHKMGQ